MVVRAKLVSANLASSRFSGDMVEVGDGTMFEATSYAWPVKPAQPGERWCRYCGWAIDGDLAWRMSCETCWSTVAPSAFQAVQIYGEIGLKDSLPSSTFLSLISSA